MQSSRKIKKITIDKENDFISDKGKIADAFNQRFANVVANSISL